MAIFRFSNMLAAAILDSKKWEISSGRTDQEGRLHHRAKFCRNKSNYGQDMAIFRFSNFADFNGRNAQEGQTAAPCQISLKSIEPQSRFGDLSIFQYGGRRHLGF